VPVSARLGLLRSASPEEVHEFSVHFLRMGQVDRVRPILYGHQHEFCGFLARDNRYNRSKNRRQHVRDGEKGRFRRSWPDRGHEPTGFGSLSRADSLGGVYHPHLGFSGKRIRIETPPIITVSIPTLISNAKAEVIYGTNEHSVQLAGVDLAGRNHVCAFFNTIEEEHRVLGSSCKDGLDRGEKAAQIVDPANREEHLEPLAEAGIHVQEMMDTGQLEVRPWTDAYVRDHRFDQDAMLATVEKLIQSGAAAGYPLTRLVGHDMDWLFFDKPATYNLVEYEARLNHVLSKQRSGDLQLQSVQIWRNCGDGHHADAPARNYRWVAAGEPILRSSRGVSR
jgi:hypothetical protein